MEEYIAETNSTYLFWKKKKKKYSTPREKMAQFLVITNQNQKNVHNRKSW